MLIDFEGKRPRVAEGAFVAPTATLIGDVTVEAGASVWYGAVLRADFGSILIGHGAVLHACRIGRGAVIGVNATVLNRAVVEEEAMVAAGSVVAENAEVPSRHLAAGVPAQVKKELSGSALQWVSRGAKSYQELTRRYLANP